MHAERARGGGRITVLGLPVEAWRTALDPKIQSGNGVHRVDSVRWRPGISP